MDNRALRLINLVRAALRRVEETSDPETEGQAVQELKSSVVLTIAERELRTTEGLDQAELGKDDRQKAA
jgi:hypothetical protein